VAKKVRSMLAGFFLAVCLLSSAVSADTITTSKTYTAVYRDSIIQSWIIGRFYYSVTFSYENNYKRLVNNKAINYSSKSTFMSFSDVSTTWNWYDTQSYKGTGNAEVRFKAGVGIDTKWVTIGSYGWSWIDFTCKGDGTSWFY